jgi:small conductance mechanosensitive channel
MNSLVPHELGQFFYKLDEIHFVRIALIFATAFVLIAMVKRVLPWVARQMPGKLRLYILPLVPVLRVVIIFVSVLSVIPLVIKPTAQNLVALFGAVGLALGFAFKDYASGLIAGIVVLYEQPYRPGDWVTVDGIYGEIESMGLRSFSMVTPDDSVVTVPHAKIWTDSIQNANDGKREHMCVADFYLHPDHDAATVRRKLQDVALASPYLQLKRPVQVVVANRPWGTHYRLKAYPIDGRDEFRFVSDLTVRGKSVLTTLGIRWASVPAAVTVNQ